ncbi:MAG: hypothetical protein H7246_16890, partial [Phycisphaerae bacterium]|nr:hypothetical protein [Saprospiraceae bacterium]
MKSIEICIGIIFIYLLLSLIATILMELIAGYTAHRGRMLKQGIKELLDQKSDALSTMFFSSPLFKQLKKAEGTLPSYISSNRFWDIIFQYISKGVNGEIKIENLEAQVKENLPEGDFKETILLYIKKADGKMDKLQKLLNQWYEECMDGLSGWYKRRTQTFLLALGFSIAAIFNANTIKIYQVLNSDDDTRAAIVKMAEDAISKETVFRNVNPINKEDSARLDSAMMEYRATLDTLRQQYVASANLLGLGWRCDCPRGGSWAANDSTDQNNTKNALFNCPKDKNQS